MYARTLTQQPTHPPTHPSSNEVKTCSLFFIFWHWFWCTCLRRDEFSCFRFCSIFYNKYFIFAYFSCDLKGTLSTADPSPKFGLGDAITFGVTIFRASISARISTKNHRFRRAFWCNSLRRVDFFVVPFLNEFRQKKNNLGVLFDAITFGVSIFCGSISARISTKIH